MFTPQFSLQIHHRPASLTTCITSRRLPKISNTTHSSVMSDQSSHRSIGLRPLKYSSSTAIDVKEQVNFLYDDLPHIFDDQGIDPTAYDDDMKFRDPITRYDSLRGYLFNIAFLKVLFRPQFFLHWVKQTGPYEITTRWTTLMKFMLLPWKPQLVFTGTSVMRINPKTGKLCTQLDFWDSIKNNEYFSLEGVLYVAKQYWFYNTPDLETPKYQILKRTANYEVRKYAPFIVVETSADRLSGSTGFSDVVGYIEGKNSAMEQMPMTTPVFTQADDAQLSNVSIQIVLPSAKDLSSLPTPDEQNARLRRVEGGTAAAVKFSGRPSEKIVREKEEKLRENLIEDDLKPKTGCLFARYNYLDPTWSFVMRNEVLIWVEQFSLE